MTRKVLCAKLKKELDGLETPPFPGELGKRIFDEISQEAWNKWLFRQTVLINEYSMSMLDDEARDFITRQMQSYFFGKKAENK